MRFDLGDILDVCLDRLLPLLLFQSTHNLTKKFANGGKKEEITIGSEKGFNDFLKKISKKCVWENGFRKNRLSRHFKRKKIFFDLGFTSFAAPPSCLSVRCI